MEKKMSDKEMKLITFELPFFYVFAIESFESFIESAKLSLQDLAKDPPAQLVGGAEWGKQFTVEKPKNFDPADENSYAATRPRTYESEYAKRVRDYKLAIKGARAELKFLQGRLSGWVNPAVSGE